MLKTKIGLITLITVTLACIIAVLYEFDVVGFSHEFLMAVRWIVATVLVVNALFKKN